jgi:hypothetical protein
MTLVLAVKPQFLLLKDGFLGDKVVAVFLKFLVLVLLLNEGSLVGDPLLLDLQDFVLFLLDLLVQVVLLCFIRAGALVLSLVFLDICQFPVKLIHLVLPLLNVEMLLPDLFLLLLEIVSLLLQFFNQILKFLL